jgi:hypothetical protein
LGGKINAQQGVLVEHVIQFSKLWEMIGSVQLSQDTTDEISWKFGKDGSYLASPAYKIQFL